MAPLRAGIRIENDLGVDGTGRETGSRRTQDRILVGAPQPKQYPSSVIDDPRPLDPAWDHPV